MTDTNKLESLLLEGRYDELFTEIRALQDKTNHYYTILSLAKIFYGRHRFADAIELLFECQKIRPNDPEVLLYAGLCLSSLGLQKEAYNMLMKTIETGLDADIDPNYELAKICFYFKKDFVGARHFYEQALRHNPSKSDLISYKLGYLNLAFGNYDQAIFHLKRCKALERLQDLLYSCAVCSVFLDNYEEACGFLRDLIAGYGGLYGSERLLNNLLTDGSTDKVRALFQSTNTSTVDRVFSDRFANYSKETMPLIGFFRDNWHLSSFFNELDGLFLYCLIRETKPKNVIEFAPYRGCSTVYIYKALQANGTEFNFRTFDIAETSEFTEAMRQLEIPLKVTCGDALKTVPQYIKESNLEGKIDLCFVDADHSYEFAKRYTEEILPLLGDRCIIIAHDMYYSPVNFDLPFDHYAPINPEDITENPASIGEAKALREFFLKRNDYVLFSTHRLFGGIGDCSPILPLNISLLEQLGMDELYSLERGKFWNQAPLLLVAFPKTLWPRFYHKNLSLSRVF